MLKVAVPIITLLGASFFVLDAYGATCASNQANQSFLDDALWQTHECRPEYVNFHFQRYDLRYDDWSEKGWTDACDPLQAYGKHWNATWLIDYAISFDSPWWSPSGRAFHHSVDYGSLTEHSSSGYHDAQRHMMAGYSLNSNGTQPILLGKYQTPVAASNRVNTYCETYDVAETGARGNNVSPDMRAAVMVHESTHGFYHKIGFYWGSCGGHYCPGELTAASNTPFCSQPGCDLFYFHGARAYGKDMLWYQDDNLGRGQYFHTPYQSEIEFLCDLAAFGAEWLPMSVIQDAQAQSMLLGTQALINGPGIACGTMKPF